MAATLSVNDFLPSDHAAQINKISSSVPIRMICLADSGGTDARTEFVVGTSPRAGTLTSISLTGSSAVTSNDSAYATFAFALRDGAGTSPTALATLTTKTIAGSGGGSWTAFVPVDVGTLAASAVAAGSLLTCTITKAAGGVTLPVFEILAKIDL
jgi:hypothetical protein